MKKCGGLARHHFQVRFFNKHHESDEQLIDRQNKEAEQLEREIMVPSVPIMTGKVVSTDMMGRQYLRATLP